MSVIVRDPAGRVLLLCKGADTIVFDRIVTPSPIAVATQEHLNAFAAIGLRTLCLAQRVVDEGEYQKWAKVRGAGLMRGGHCFAGFDVNPPSPCSKGVS
jgi:magnesium-transporting ATPase (P-type)